MSRADLSWRCPSCFNWNYAGDDSCRHCGFTFPKQDNTSDNTPPKGYGELPDDEVRLHFFWTKASVLRPDQMDRAEVFWIITDDNQKAIIQPPYYESRDIVVKKGKIYTLRIQSLYRGKVLHEYPYQLNVDKDVIDTITILIDRIPFTIKKLFGSKTINIIKIDHVDQCIWD